MNHTSSYPILYSLRHCPYAMRARIAIYKSRKSVLLRDLVLSNKPPEMLISSPKGTVPVLVVTDSEDGEAGECVIEESIEVMLWALAQSDPNDLLHKDNTDALPEMFRLVSRFDTEFKNVLEKYKCAKRYKESNLIESRQKCEPYLLELEQRLQHHSFLISDKESFADIALLPFIRQFARVERQWYLQSPYPNLRQWLNTYLQSVMFTKVMAKYPLWMDERKELIFHYKN
ncbi:glutathione S-transferase [Alteromonas sp. 5E99-2]|uniref:glutathione S-transferase n=1 Tax=Alteromonas sp. 5E99-2 TaxID=2817683 RepID=UPI001A995F7C|nr:glutathione S-transferase [Alteromonas sp. 5E99-2]MBO1255751.1 glutathione S-transferase [Alteromonas sp. 5E99-2]